MLRVAVLNGAQFEWRVHYPAYLQAGGTEEKAQALKNAVPKREMFDDQGVDAHYVDRSIHHKR